MLYYIIRVINLYCDFKMTPIRFVRKTIKFLSGDFFQIVFARMFYICEFDFTQNTPGQRGKRRRQQ